jgi:peptidoglycan/LPS O-acetylase OafA/YrhL
VIEVVAFFGSVLTAGALALAVSGWVRRTGWVLLAPAALGAAGSAWLSLKAGYAGWPRELLIGCVAAAALVLPIGLMIAKMPDPKRPRPSDRPALAVVFVPLLVGVIFTWTGRVTWAQKMAWSCNGTIVEKYRSDNHQAPTLVVRNGDGTSIKLEGVKGVTWDRAAVDDRLRKEAGRNDGQLNGQAVELVLRNGW